MAGPITWQNVGQANFGDAAGFMQMSSQNANQAFSSAIKRTTEQEAKVKAGKTNALANQIYGITDPETLRAFQSKINLEDPTIDSNVINDAVLKQGSILESRAVNASNIAQNNQQIEASKTRSAVDVATLGLTAADQAFRRNLETQKAKQADDLFSQEKQKNEFAIKKEQNSSIAREAAGTAIAVRSQGGDGAAALAEVYGTTKDLTVLAEATKLYNETIVASESFNPAEAEDVKNVQGKFTQERDKIAQAGEIAKKSVMEEYKDIPKDLVDARAAMAKNGTNTPEAVVTEFTEDLAKIDKDAATEFATQSGGKLTSSGNEGAVGILKNVADANSPMNVAYQIAIGQRKEVPIINGEGRQVGTRLELAKGVTEGELSKVTALQLKMALKAHSPAGNIIDDGVDVTLIGKEAAKYEKDMLKIKEMEQKLTNTESQFLKQLNDKNAEEAKAIDEMRRIKKNQMGNAINNFVNGRGDRFPYNANDPRNNEMGYY